MPLVAAPKKPRPPKRRLPSRRTLGGGGTPRGRGFLAHGNDLHDDGRYPQPLEQGCAASAGVFTGSSFTNPLLFLIQ
jgi:hypothetical protein